MTNHALTLLVNRDADAAQNFTVPGAELLHPTFRTVNLPSHLDAVRAVLFGTDPDAVMLFFRTRQLLAVTHATPLESYIAALDPRLTYRFADDSPFVDATVFRPTVTALNPASEGRLSVIGSPDPPDATGRCRHAFLLETLTESTVQVGRQTAPIQNPVFEFTPGGTVPLAGAGYEAKLKDAWAGQKWLVELTNRPERDPSTLVDLAGQVGEPVLHTLFGAAPAEPYKTFRNLWQRSDEVPLRLAALTLALVYRSEESRVQ